MDEWYMKLVIAAIPTVWALFKTTDWYRKHVAARYDQAVECVEVGVVKTYQGYVQALKANDEFGDPNKKEARSIAATIARSYAQEKGPKVARLLTDEFIAIWTERKITEAKAAAKETK